MKHQTTHYKKTLANHASIKGLITRIYKELLQLKRTENQF